MATNTTIRVRPGCTVRLKRVSDGVVVEYRITRAVHGHTWLNDESLNYTLNERVISNESPLGNALIGHKIGEVVRGYEIVDISRTEDAIDNLSDSTEEVLLDKRDRLLYLEKRVKSGGALDAIILSFSSYLYPRKGKVSISEAFYKTETGDSILEDVSVTNIKMEDTGYLKVQIELYDSEVDDGCNIKASLIIDKTTFEKIGVRYSPKTIGRYSYGSNNNTVALRSVLARIDLDTGDFVFEYNPLGSPYYLEIKEIN